MPIITYKLVLIVFFKIYFQMKATNFYTKEVIHDQRRRKGQNQMKFTKFYPEKYEFCSFLTKAQQLGDEKDK